MQRDPRVEPMVGDIVLPIGKPFDACGEIRYHPLTVQARLGNLVAFTEDGSPNKVVWLLLSSWCEVFDPITEWKVIHATK